MSGTLRQNIWMQASSALAATKEAHELQPQNSTTNNKQVRFTI